MVTLPVIIKTMLSSIILMKVKMKFISKIDADNIIYSISGIEIPVITSLPILLNVLCM